MFLSPTVANFHPKAYRSSHLRYPGGKIALAPYLSKVIESNSLTAATYVEPFAGGAGAAIALLLAGCVRDIHINDLDPRVFAFWRVITACPDYFIERIQLTPLNVEEWRRQKRLYTDPSSSVEDKAFSFFYLNRTNRSGILNGGPIGGLAQTGKWTIEARFNKENLISRIRRIAEMRDRITVTNIDGISLLDNLDPKTCFIYLDPPYYEKGGSLYMNHYKDEDHRKLAEALTTRQHLRWLLTYDDVEPIRMMYSGQRMEELVLNYSARNITKGSEIMVFSNSLKMPNIQHA